MRRCPRSPILPIPLTGKAVFFMRASLAGLMEPDGRAVTSHGHRERDATDSVVLESGRQCHQVPKSGMPQVHISSLRNRGNQWTFSVQDNGLGSEPQYFERIFGLFQRLHILREFAGIGIGPAIFKKIVDRHGGRISVESKPGRGSAFHLSLSGREGKS